MIQHTNLVFPTFDFSAALSYALDERIKVCIERERNRLVADKLWDLFSLPPIPNSGASKSELARLESQLGIGLPTEYRLFLQSRRYLILGDGLQIWGFDHDGVRVGTPWLSNNHRAGAPYLVFGDYWNYADGDQLMFELSEPSGRVIVYLHEHGPLFEEFAPSFSLALWRIVHERL